jgi:hypothetical protein
VICIVFVNDFYSLYTIFVVQFFFFFTDLIKEKMTRLHSPSQILYSVGLVYISVFMIIIIAQT